MMNLNGIFLFSGINILEISIKSIGIAGATVGIIGLIIGILLGIAANIFHVEEDKQTGLIREMLPGSNCGGCGYAGCDALAKAMADGIAPANSCPVAGKEINAKISKLLGKAVTKETEKQVAFVKCNGTCDKTETKYEYYGIADCKKASVVPGAGDKACSYGCIGYGTCERVCKFDAIHIVNGIAVVDREKCVACNKCVLECPNHIIELVPHNLEHMVQCSSKAKGKEVKSVCSTGCIGCKLCVKQCEFDAVHVENNLAYIDPEKCTNCGKCAEKCPQKIIV